MGVSFIKFPIIIILLLFIASPFASENNSNLYTKKERTAIGKLRQLVNDLLVHDYQRKDGYLLRFIRASNFNTAQSAEKLKKYLQYREENSIDSISSFNLRPHQKYLPYHLEGFDRDGRPIFQILFGKWQIRKYVMSGKIDNLLIYFRRLLDSTIGKIFQTAESTRRDIDQLYMIGDLSGLAFRNQLCLGCISTTLDLARSYDGIIGIFSKNITLINVPRIWQPILSRIKRVLSLDSLNSLSAYGNDENVWKQALLRDISPDQLPVRLGGTNTNFE